MQTNLLVVPFEPWPLKCLEVREEQKDHVEALRDIYAGLEEYGNILKFYGTIEDGEFCAWTALIDGVVSAVGGITQHTPYLGESWTLIGNNLLNSTGRVKVKLFRRIKQSLDKCLCHRIQATTDANFKEGNDFLIKLGFQYEGTLRGYGPDKGDHCMYGYVKE